MTAPAEPRVLIVDDHQLFRAGVRAELEPLLEIAGEAGSVEAAIAAIEARSPDVVLLDVHMPDGVLDGRGVAEHVDEAVELGPHAGAEQLVVVDDHDRRHRSITSSTSVPSPGAVCSTARPPWRSIRPTIDSRTPRRSAGTRAGSKPGPRSRTNTSIRSGATSA